MIGDRFDILDEIGSGPLGKVVRATYRKTGQPVALRIIEEADAARAERLLRVGRRAASVTHVHVVRVLDCGHDDGCVWVAMELVSGRTLAKVLEDDGPFPAERLLQVGLELCAGLEAHHRTGLVHRDLKPGNVMLTSQGVKIMDVGLAHALAREGTAPYASPEARHGYPVDERSDLYSLGVLLVELATGAGFSFDGDVDKPLQLPAHLPAPLGAVILRLLHLDRGARYHSAAAVAEALAATASPAVAPLRRRRRRRAAAVGVGVIAVAGIVGLLALVRGRVGVVLPAIFTGCERP